MKLKGKCSELFGPVIYELSVTKEEAEEFRKLKESLDKALFIKNFQEKFVSLATQSFPGSTSKTPNCFSSEPEMIGFELPWEEVAESFINGKPFILTKV